MHSKHYTLILVRNEGSRFRKWRLSQVQLVALGVAVGLVTLGASYSIWSAFSSHIHRTELTHLQAENETLRLTNQSFETRLDGLQTRLSDSEDRTRKLAIVAGLENLGASSEAGVGGRSVTEPQSGPAAELAQVEGRSEYLSQTLAQVETRLSDNLRLISSTPSIAPVRGIYTSPFGFRRDPITGQRAYHSGVDISAPPGKPVKAAADGVVTKTEQYGALGLGRAVYVAHGFGVTTVYGHLSRINVTPGQRIERGAIVGLVGNTGRSTGYHLHYEVQVNGQPTNPLAYILDRADGAL